MFRGLKDWWKTNFIDVLNEPEIIDQAPSTALVPYHAPRRTREDRINEKCEALCYEWYSNIYQAFLNEKGIELSFPGMFHTGRIYALLFDAERNTEMLKTWLRSDNNLYLVPRGFETPPSVDMRGKYVMVSVGLPPNLTQATINLPQLWPISIAERDQGAFVLGVDLYGKEIVSEFGNTVPHMLISGTSGAGKSEALKLIVYELAQTGCELILADLKFGATLQNFDRLNGALFPLAMDNAQLKTALEWALQEMSERYSYLRQYKNLGQYSRLFVVIDELQRADKENMKLLNILLQQGRQSGIHVIAAIQNPINNNLNGLDLKANFDARLVLKVVNDVASEVALGNRDFDASRLLGKGDAIFKTEESLTRLQVYYLSPKRIEKDQIYQPILAESESSLALPSPREVNLTEPEREDNPRSPEYKEKRRKLADAFIREHPERGQVELAKHLKDQGVKFGGTTLSALYQEMRSMYPLSSSADR